MPAGIYIYTQDIYIYITRYIYIHKRQRKAEVTENQRERERDSKTKTNKKEEWFHFYIKYRVKNIAKGLPPCTKKWKPVQNIKHLCYQIQNFTLNDK